MLDDTKSKAFTITKDSIICSKSLYGIEDSPTFSQILGNCLGLQDMTVKGEGPLSYLNLSSLKE